MSSQDSILFQPFLLIYQLIQWFLDKLLSPAAPAPGAQLGRPKIAIIGAGLTGVAAASHCVGHGFDVRIFEKGDRKALGGIWSVSCIQMIFIFRYFSLPSETYPIYQDRTTADITIASKQHIRPPNPQHNVPLPSFHPMGRRLPLATTNRLPNNHPLETVRSRTQNALLDARRESLQRRPRPLDNQRPVPRALRRHHRRGGHLRR